MDSAKCVFYTNPYRCPYNSGNPIADFATPTDTMRELGIQRKDISYSIICGDFVPAGIDCTSNDTVESGYKVSVKEWASTDFLTMRYTNAEERADKLGFILDVITEYEEEGEFDEAEQLCTSLVGQIGLSREIEQACLPERRSQKRKRSFMK